MTDLTLRMLLLGEDKSASSSLDHVGASARRTEGLLSHLGRSGHSVLSGLGAMKPINMVAGLGLAGGAAAVAGFANSSVGAFSETAKAARTTQRVMGGSIQDASRLNFGAKQMGIGTDQLTAALGKAEKNLVANAGATQKVTTNVMVATGAWKKQTETVRDAAGHFKTISEMVPVEKMQKITTIVSKGGGVWASMGIKIKDAHGALLPMGAILPQLEAKFASMENGPKKTALALTIFGKAGAGMLPLLNKGGEGMKHLAEESDKLGQTIGPDAIAKIAAQRRAHLALTNAMQSLKVTVGGALMPVMTKMLTIFSSVAVPAIAKLTAWFSTKLVPVLKRDLPPVLAELSAVFKNDIVPVLKTAGAVFASVFGFFAHHIALTKALAVVLGTVAVAIGTLLGVARVITAVTRAWTAVQTALNIVMSLNPVALVVIAIVALIAIIVVIATKTTWFQTIWRVAWGAIHGAIMFVWNWIKSNWPLLLAILMGPVALAVLLIVRYWGAIHAGIMFVWNWIKSNWPLLLAIITGPIAMAVWLIAHYWGAIKAGASAVISWITGGFSSLVGFFSGLPARISAKLGNIFGFLKDGFRTVINGVIDIWNKLHFKIPGFSILGHKFGGADVGLPQLPHLDMGGQMFDGLTTVGENGPELMFKSGSRVDVLSHPQSRSYLSAGQAGDTYVFNVQALDPAGAGRAVARALETHVGTGGTVRMASGIR
jgi:hypothetical protein